MYFANPWGLFGLLALPAILGIHLFRRRFPVLEVAGAHLWGIETRVADAGRRKDKLPWTTSLILELLAALLLTLVLADPRVDSAEEFVQFVAVLDDSASMQSRPVDEKSFRESAIEELQKRAAKIGTNGRITLLKTGRHPTLVGSRAMTWDETLKALDDWKPSAPRHDFQPTWDEAVQLVGPESPFLFLTDQPLSSQVTKPKGMTVIAVGTPLDNLAISTAKWNRDRQTGASSVYMRVTNIGSHPVTAIVRGETIPEEKTTPKQLVFEQKITLDPTSERPLEVALPEGLARMELSIDSPTDPLEIDNHVLLVESPRRIVRVAVTLPAGSAERELTERVLDLLPGVVTASPDEADLIIGRAGEMPSPRASLWWLGIGPINMSDAYRKQSTTVNGPYLIEKQNSLVDGVTLGGVVWGGVQDSLLPVVPIISYDRTVLLGRIEGTATTAWLMNIDLSASNLGDSPDWPILLTNLVELRRESLPGLSRTNYRIEEIVRLTLPPVLSPATATPATPAPPATDPPAETPAATAPESPTASKEENVATPETLTRNAGRATLKLVTPEGRSRPLVRDRRDVVELPPLDLPGIYRIYDGDAMQGELAMNFFDSGESSLQGMGSEIVEPETVYEPSKISLDNPFSWLIVVAVLMILAAILMDWHVLGSPRGANRQSA
ncbi:MAG: BatA domain-containing protein [Planctomycetaceae bacterium]